MPNETKPRCSPKSNRSHADWAPMISVCPVWLIILLPFEGWSQSCVMSKCKFESSIQFYKEDSCFLLHSTATKFQSTLDCLHLHLQNIHNPDKTGLLIIRNGISLMVQYDHTRSQRKTLTDRCLEPKQWLNVAGSMRTVFVGDKGQKCIGFLLCCSFWVKSAQATRGRLKSYFQKALPLQFTKIFGEAYRYN